MKHMQKIKQQIMHLFKNKNITGSCKDVLMCLTGYVSSKKGVAWPSNETLSERTGWSLSSIVRAVKQGIEAGILKVTRRMHRKGRYLVRQSNLYVFVVSSTAEDLEPSDKLLKHPTRAYWKNLKGKLFGENLSVKQTSLGKTNNYSYNEPTMEHADMLQWCLNEAKIEAKKAKGWN